MPSSWPDTCKRCPFDFFCPLKQPCIQQIPQYIAAPGAFVLLWSTKIQQTHSFYFLLSAVVSVTVERALPATACVLITTFFYLFFINLAFTPQAWKHEICSALWERIFRKQTLTIRLRRCWNPEISESFVFIQRRMLETSAFSCIN